MSAPRYTGNVPSNVAKEAKYAVVHGPRDMEIRLIYRLSNKEKALITTHAHPRLVKMVNRVKEDHADVPGGAFYINEYSFVLVPAPGGCYYAGTYREYLEFTFEGRVIGPKASDGLEPGQVWQGPRVGTAYTLAADGRDIRYSLESRPNVFSERRLSEAVGTAAAQRLARRLSEHKPGGGRIYINEAREFFAPMQSSEGLAYVYLGPLGEDSWFPAPAITD